MNKDLQRAEIIRLVKKLAEEDGGIAPGKGKFENSTGIREHEWRGRLWRKWNDILSEAGFENNAWNVALSDDRILTAVADLARRLGNFPNSVDMAFEHANNLDFPDSRTIAKRWTMLPLARAVLDVAQQTGDSEVAAHCTAYLAKVKPKIDEPDEAVAGSVMGYVYMVRYGKHYKIGRTSSLSRRSRQIQIELPEVTDLVHAILTDDPVGVEAYWHKRFEQHRGNGEWFRLPKDALASFRRWTKIA